MMEKESPHKFCIEHRALKDRIKATCGKMDLQFHQVEKNIETAKHDINELRKQLIHQASQFADKHEIKLLLDHISKRIDTTNITLMELKGKLDERSGSVKWTEHIITALIGSIVLIGVWFLTH